MELYHQKIWTKCILLFNETQKLLKYTILKIFQLQILACFVLFVKNIKIPKILVSTLVRKVGMKKS